MTTKERISRSEPRRNQTTDGAYPPLGSRQSAGTFERLRRRRVTRRTMLAYATALIILIFAQPVAVSFAAGTVLVIAGVLLRIWSFGHLRKNQTLVTTGPYAHTRNPAYVASCLIMTGLFLAAGNPFTGVGIALWVAGLIGIAVFWAPICRENTSVNMDNSKNCSRSRLSVTQPTCRISSRA